MSPYIIVDDVSEEYQYMRAQECDVCEFKGSYKVKMQKLLQINEKPHDVLECKCKMRRGEILLVRCLESVLEI